jgi:hypothetical protein
MSQAQGSAEPAPWLKEHAAAQRHKQACPEERHRYQRPTTITSTACKRATGGWFYDSTDCACLLGTAQTRACRSPLA